MIYVGTYYLHDFVVLNISIVSFYVYQVKAKINMFGVLNPSGVFQRAQLALAELPLFERIFIFFGF